tara:strand:+ start:708 stop:1094 length:387 start_codon:yes stop_codon:yes gene_type:complete
MKKRESLLWQRIKKLKLKGQIFRIESNTINGIPDIYWLLNGQSIWIELKSNNIKNCGLSKFQINWHNTHFKNGGRSFILQRDHSLRRLKLYELRGSRVVNLLAEGVDDNGTLDLHFDCMRWHCEKIKF